MVNFKDPRVIDRVYVQALKEMERGVNVLANHVDPPQFLEELGAFRYTEKTIQQAIILKLVRTVSTLYAVRSLCNLGLVQEQASLQRIASEIYEDILFLAFGILQEDSESLLHKKYLEEFFQEEPRNAKAAMESTRKHRSVPRKEIRKYVSHVGGIPEDSGRTHKVFMEVNRLFSGYVHAASPQIMDIYRGDPPRFHMRDIRKEPGIYEPYRKSVWHSFYGGLAAFGITAAAFGDRTLSSRFRIFTTQFFDRTNPNVTS